jgi:hypothetical protein
MNRRLRGFAASIEHADRGLLGAVGVLLFIGSIIVLAPAATPNRLSAHRWANITSFSNICS